MKKYIYIILAVLFYAKGISQELPKGFKEQVQIDFNSISEEVKINELNQDFEAFFKSRKEEYIRKQQRYTTLSSNRSVSNLCDNGTFESGDINTGDWNFYWAGQQGNISGTNRLNTGSFNTGGGHNVQVHHQVQSAGPDPYFPALNKVYSFPTGNTKSLRLGNALAGCGLESIQKVVTITPSNANFTFSYAMVMDNPAGHGNALPFFEVNLINAANPTINYNNLINLGNNSNRISSDNPLLTPNESNAVRRWKDWSCVTSDLSSLIGQTIIIEFVNRDCWACGHWSYTYLDNICVSCEGANGDEGSINLNQGLSDDCEIPGRICIDYTLPNGNNPSLDIELQIIQNGTVVNTINSPTLTSGSNYCFNLNASNTNGLNTSLQGFDFKVIGQPKLGTFNLTPKIIGNSSDGITQGANNDYDIFCPPNFDCCPEGSKLNLTYTKDNDVANVPNGATWSQNVPLSITEELWTITQPNTIPIIELRINIQDFEFTNNIDACASCVNNPGHWASLGHKGGQWQNVGSGSGILTPVTSYNPILGDRINQRELVWENQNGVIFNANDQFSFNLIFPPFSEIPCCVTSVKVCYKVTWKDANCNICEEYVCVTYDLN